MSAHSGQAGDWWEYYGYSCTSRGAYPDFMGSDVSVYLNGREDGLRGDTFRLDYDQTQGDLLRDAETA